jgi:hypothetical protein
VKKYSLHIDLTADVEAHTTEEAVNITHQFYNGAKARSICVRVYEEPEVVTVQEVK